jgi:hypothetical protein
MRLLLLLSALLTALVGAGGPARALGSPTAASVQAERHAAPRDVAAAARVAARTGAHPARVAGAADHGQDQSADVAREPAFAVRRRE